MAARLPPPCAPHASASADGSLPTPLRMERDDKPIDELGRFACSGEMEDLCWGTNPPHDGTASAWSTLRRRLVGGFTKPHLFAGEGAIAFFSGSTSSNVLKSSLCLLFSATLKRRAGWTAGETRWSRRDPASAKLEWERTSPSPDPLLVRGRLLMLYPLLARHSNARAAAPVLCVRPLPSAGFRSLLVVLPG